MRCIAANRSVLTVLDQNTTLPDDYDRNQTALTHDIASMDIIQFADGWYSHPDLNTFDSDLLLDTLTLRVRACETSAVLFDLRLVSLLSAYQTDQSDFTLECQS